MESLSALIALCQHIDCFIWSMCLCLLSSQSFNSCAFKKNYKDLFLASPWSFSPHRNKAILFYFNILQCANPTVLINLQCPTTQVPQTPFSVLYCMILLLWFMDSFLCFSSQLCVSKCPDRFATYIDMQYSYRRNKSYWEYYKQFCKPGFNNPDKVWQRNHT